MSIVAESNAFTLWDQLQRRSRKVVLRFGILPMMVKSHLKIFLERNRICDKDMVSSKCLKCDR